MVPPGPCETRLSVRGTDLITTTIQPSTEEGKTGIKHHKVESIKILEINLYQNIFASFCRISVRSSGKY
jgi:hypothetical protein